LSTAVRLSQLCQCSVAGSYVKDSRITPKRKPPHRGGFRALARN